MNVAACAYWLHAVQSGTLDLLGQLRLAPGWLAPLVPFPQELKGIGVGQVESADEPTADLIRVVCRHPRPVWRVASP